MAFVSSNALLLGKTGLRSAQCSSAATFVRPKRVAVRMALSEDEPPSPEHHDGDMFEGVEDQVLLDTMRQVEGAFFAAMVAMGPGAAMAADDDALKALFKTKPATLAHPAAMWLIFASALYTFYLGYQSSRVRAVSPAERKELVKKKFGEKHFKTSSAIMAVMTIATFEGMANTYTRAGKLFPGPHLYAGLGLVALLTTMSSLVPEMQKGKGWARDTHFGLAFLATGLFAWQAQSGMQIVGKILGWS